MAKDLITRDECISTHNSLMEQLNDIKKDVGNVAIKVAELPSVLSEKFDERYASKRTEKEVYELKEKMENRNYEWLKYLVGIIVGVVLAYLGLK